MNFLIFICVVSPALSYTCRDTYDGCKSLGKIYCEDPTHFLWVYKNCAETCGFCRYYIDDKMTYPTITSPPNTLTTTTMTTTAMTTTAAIKTTTSILGQCVDVYNNCEVYRSACGQSQFMRDYCKQTCGECVPTPIIEAGKSFVFG